MFEEIVITCVDFFYKIKNMQVFHYWVWIADLKSSIT
jgi:hypothetical protein